VKELVANIDIPKHFQNFTYNAAVNYNQVNINI